jgi:hypothetical protein
MALVLRMLWQKLKLYCNNRIEKFYPQQFNCCLFYAGEKNIGIIFYCISIKIMKPLFEFILACLLVAIAGCSAIAGIFNAGMWTAFLLAAAIIGLVFLFHTKAKQ